MMSSTMSSRRSGREYSSIIRGPRAREGIYNIYTDSVRGSKTLQQLLTTGKQYLLLHTFTTCITLYVLYVAYTYTIMMYYIIYITTYPVTQHVDPPTISSPRCLRVVGDDDVTQ